MRLPLVAASDRGSRLGTRRGALLASLLLVTLLGGGCESLPHQDPALVGPFFTPTNQTGVARLPAEIRRVVVLPLHGGPGITEETLLRLDQVFSTELGRTARFEVVTATRDDLGALVTRRQLGSTEALPARLLQQLATKYAADAVLFTDITSYSPYPPLALGIRTKLVRLGSGEALWASDNVFSAAQPAVANSARRHVHGLGRERGPGDLTHTILQNPVRFAGYVAAATFAGLPPR